ncbi:MAG: glycosyltransferase family 39 protein [Phycisphaerales bacterium]|nr:glycosyltransferase family 39 protein [Phycisphaerales bacterium]
MPISGTDPVPAPPRAARQALILLMAWAVVCLPLLGTGGLHSTEGHRAIPGWEMLDRLRAEGPSVDALLVPTLFGEPYLRKPPGIAWATAASAAALGETEFSARLPSALAMLGMTLAAWWFARRWFGPRRAVAAGLAHLLMPWLWASARSAEIESLNLLGAQVGALAAVDLARRPASRAVVVVMLGALGIALMGVMKGPAGVPSLVGALLAPCVVARSLRPLTCPRLWAMLALGAAPLLLLAWATARQAARLDSVVTQPVDDFLWNKDRLWGVALLAPAALIAMLPASLALLFPWGPDARAEAGDRLPPAEVETARTLAWACLLALGVLVVAGVSNPRYAMPAAVFAPPLAAYVFAGAGGAFVPIRAGIARALMLGRPVAWGGVLLVGVAAHVAWFEARARATSGLDAGAALADALPDGATVLADHLVEARPEVLLYAARRAREQGRSVSVRWEPGLASLGALGPGVFAGVRTDAGSDEGARLESAGLSGRLERIHDGRVHEFSFALVRGVEVDVDPKR